MKQLKGLPTFSKLLYLKMVVAAAFLFLPFLIPTAHSKILQHDRCNALIEVPDEYDKIEVELIQEETFNNKEVLAVSWLAHNNTDRLYISCENLGQFFSNLPDQNNDCAHSIETKKPKHTVCGKIGFLGFPLQSDMVVINGVDHIKVEYIGRLGNNRIGIQQETKVKTTDIWKEREQVVEQVRQIANNIKLAKPVDTALKLNYDRCQLSVKAQVNTNKLVYFRVIQDEGFDIANEEIAADFSCQKYKYGSFNKFDAERICPKTKLLPSSVHFCLRRTCQNNEQFLYIVQRPMDRADDATETAYNYTHSLYIFLHDYDEYYFSGIVPSYYINRSHKKIFGLMAEVVDHMEYDGKPCQAEWKCYGNSECNIENLQTYFDAKPNLLLPLDEEN